MKNIYKYDEPSKLCFREGNPKTDKNRKIEGLDKYLILRLNLAPYTISGLILALQRLLVVLQLVYILQEIPYLWHKKT